MDVKLIRGIPSLNAINYKILFFINGLIFLTLIATWITLPELLTFNISTTVVFLLMTLMLMAKDKERIALYLKSYHFKNVVANLVNLFLVLSVLALINYLVYKHPVQFDLTKNKYNSLSAQTMGLLKEVKSKVTLKIIVSKMDRGALLPLVDLYRVENSHINLEVYDVELRPDLLKLYDLSKSAAIIVEHDSKKSIVYDFNELNITNAIIRVMRASDPVIYFTTNHDEVVLTDEGKDGYSIINKYLLESTYQIKTINLTTAEIPSDIKLLAIVGPRLSFLEVELKKIDNYLARGGKLLALIDPEFKNPKLGTLRELISHYGIKVNNDLVVDSINHVSGGTGAIPIITEYSRKHIITSDFKKETFFPVVSSVNPLSDEIKKGEQLFKVTPLLFSSSFPAAWSETNLNDVSKGNAKFNEKEDVKGPISIVSVAEETKNNGAKIAIIGNSSFVVNGYNEYSSNFNLFLNVVNWLVEDDAILKSIISPKRMNINEGPLLIGTPTLGIVFYFSVIVGPLILFALAIYFYRRRKRL